jgi:hypothetical protein
VIIAGRNLSEHNILLIMSYEIVDNIQKLVGVIARGAGKIL